MAGVVLIAIDASSQAQKAFDWYIEHIHQDGNKLVILHCVDLSTISLEEEDSNTSFSQQWNKHDSQIKEIEGTYRWKMNEVGICGKMKTASGKPGDVIVSMAKEEKAGLIVIGSRGLGRLKRTLVGSVSDFVLHNAPCPVCICKMME